MLRTWISNDLPVPRTLGITPDQLRAQYAKNAAALLEMYGKTVNYPPTKKYRGYTRAQLLRMYQDADRRANISDRDCALVIDALTRAFGGTK